MKNFNEQFYITKSGNYIFSSSFIYEKILIHISVKTNIIKMHFFLDMKYDYKGH